MSSLPNGRASAAAAEDRTGRRRLQAVVGQRSGRGRASPLVGRRRVLEEERLNAQAIDSVDLRQLRDSLRLGQRLCAA